MATTDCTDEAFCTPMKSTAAYMEPIALKRSCRFRLHFREKFIKLGTKQFECHLHTTCFGFYVLYLLEPISQNIVPNIKAVNVVNRSLTAPYGGFRQYDKCCFHRQAIHWVKKGCEYCVGKYKSFEPGRGVLSSLIKALFLLNQSPCRISYYRTEVYINSGNLFQNFRIFPLNSKDISKS
jgi:hypothetical protein